MLIMYILTQYVGLDTLNECYIPGNTLCLYVYIFCIVFSVSIISFCSSVCLSSSYSNLWISTKCWYYRRQACPFSIFCRCTRYTTILHIQIVSCEVCDLNVTRYCRRYATHSWSTYQPGNCNIRLIFSYICTYWILLKETWVFYVCVARSYTWY